MMAASTSRLVASAAAARIGSGVVGGALRCSRAATTKTTQQQRTFHQYLIRRVASSSRQGSSSSSISSSTRLAILAASAFGAGFCLPTPSSTSNSTTLCDVRKDSKVMGGDVVMLGPTKEPKTGILFPRLCNGMTFVGCGVRVKYGFVKVYAVGTYMDPIAMMAIKKGSDDDIAKALLNPTYPRTIRIVMNRSLSIDKYTAAIVEALEPRMNGQDLDKLEEFKKLNPPGDLIEGAEMEMTIRGDTMLYKNSAGGVGAIHSDVFCKAMCDVYYGAEAVSPAHKEEVIQGVKGL